MTRNGKQQATTTKHEQRRISTSSNGKARAVTAKLDPARAAMAKHKPMMQTHTWELGRGCCVFRVVYHGVTDSFLVSVFCRYQIYWVFEILVGIKILVGTTFFLERGAGPLKKVANAPFLRKKGATVPLVRKKGVSANMLIPTKISISVPLVLVW